MRIGKAALVLLILFLASGTAYSETMYKWVDAQGIQRFSNQPPPPDVKEYETIPGTDEPAPGDEQRPEFRQMMHRVEQENRQNDAEARQRELERAQEAERKAEAERRSRRQAERQRLERRIEQIKKRALGPTFTQGMRQAQIDQIQKQIDALEAPGQ